MSIPSDAQGPYEFQGGAWALDCFRDSPRGICAGDARIALKETLGLQKAMEYRLTARVLRWIRYFVLTEIT